MRTATVFFLALLVAGRAHAEPCVEGPPPGASSARSISDVPYSAAPAAPPCKEPPAADLEPARTWETESNQNHFDVSRAAIVGVAFGTLLLLAGADLAICARHADDQGTRDFCHSAAPTMLWSGAAVSGLGLGTLAVATWIVPRPAETPSPRAGLSAGFTLSWALDPWRR